jgi:YidC/Oxa1 family membrane protein insertase
MDTGRFLLAIVLMIAVVVVTNLLFRPAAPPLEQVVTDTLTVQPSGNQQPGAPPGVAPQPPGAPAPAPGGFQASVPTGFPVDTVFATSPLYRLGFETAGASLVSAEILGYESFTRAGPVQLVQPDVGPLVGYTLQLPGQAVSFDTLHFTAETGGRAAAAGDTLRFSHIDPGTGRRIELWYALDPETYVINTWGTVPQAPPGTTLDIRLGPTLRSNERNLAEDERALAYVVNSRRDGIYSNALNSVRAPRVEEGPLAWVAIKNKYFLVAALSSFDDPARQFGGALVSEYPLAHAATVTARLPLDAEGRFAFRLYVGPQEYDRLVAVGGDLQDVNPYGWRVLRPIIRPLAHLITWALVGIHRILGIGYGWVLILFGILIRVVLWPLNARAMRSQLKNMELQPRMKEIQEKYRSEPERLQKEMLRLYKEEGFNPLGGCLPMLIPFPVLITLFFVFQATIEFRGVPFLWFPDLSQPDPLYILPILLGASMFLMQWLSMRSMPAQNPQMKMMLWFMPGLMVIIFLRLASGLNLYYLSMNIASIPQQLQLTRERKRMQARLPVTSPPTGGGDSASGGAGSAPRQRPARPASGQGSAGGARRRRSHDA